MVDFNEPMKADVYTPAGYILVNAEISRFRIQDPTEDGVYSFSLMIDDNPIEVARYKMLAHESDSVYKSVTLSAVAKVTAGSHTVSVVVSGKGTVVSDSDDTSYLLRHINVIAFPTIPENDNSTCCNAGYLDHNCSQPMCFGKLFNNEAVCNGRGSCIAIDQCDCYHNGMESNVRINVQHFPFHQPNSV